MGMPNITPGNEEQDSDEESSEGMPDLIDCHGDSSEENTVTFSVGLSDVTSDTESVTIVDEDSSVDERLIGTSGSSVIQIENLEVVGGDVSERYTTCFTCTCAIYGHGGHTYDACTNR